MVSPPSLVTLADSSPDRPRTSHRTPPPKSSRRSPSQQPAHPLHPASPSESETWETVAQLPAPYPRYLFSTSHRYRHGPPPSPIILSHPPLAKTPLSTIQTGSGRDTCPPDPQRAERNAAPLNSPALSSPAPGGSRPRLDPQVPEPLLVVRRQSQLGWVASHRAAS